MPSKPVHNAYIELRADDKKLASDIVAAVRKAEAKVRKIRVGAAGTDPRTGSTGGSYDPAANFFRGFSGLATLYASSRIVGSSIKTGADFETGMARIATLLSKNERGGLGTIARDIKNLGIKYGTSFKDLQSAAYESLSAQIPVGKLPKFLETAAKSGVAGASDTETAIDALTTVINAYGMSADDATRISDTLFKTVDRGKITYEQLAATIGKVAAQSALVGVSFEELTGTIATLTRAGIKPSEAMTSIYGLIAGFLNPTDEAQAAADKYGLKLNASTLQKLGFSGVAWALKDASPEDLLTIANQRKGFRAIATLNNNRAGNALDVAIMSQAMGGGTNATERAFSEFEQTFSIRMKKLANELASYFVESFDLYKDQLADIAESVTKIALGIPNNKRPGRELGTNFGNEGVTTGWYYNGMYAYEYMKNFDFGWFTRPETLNPYSEQGRKRAAGIEAAKRARQRSIEQYGEIPSYNENETANRLEQERTLANEQFAGLTSFVRAMRKRIAMGEVLASKGKNWILGKVRSRLGANQAAYNLEQDGTQELNFAGQYNLLATKLRTEKEILSYKYATGEIDKQTYEQELALANKKTDRLKKELETKQAIFELDFKSSSEELKAAEKISKLRSIGRDKEADTLEIQERYRQQREILEKKIIELQANGASQRIVQAVQGDIDRLKSIEKNDLAILKRNNNLQLGGLPYSNPTNIEGIMRTVYPSTSISSGDVDQEILGTLKNINDSFRRGVSIKEAGGILRITY